ncbi:retrovirus-related Pol polyprotein from transposon TNT 1-94 isoform X1 [Euphorbia lathyris]|uniref:retrovirus-related Pol polyprotein from transposon TNT 1-94 isoform X1 n=1 Tax=Euphorbia lathyris TaxID=212925 RepID=UPI00331428F9
MASSKTRPIQHFQLVDGMQLQMIVSGSLNGNNVRIELQLKNCTRVWVLHWGCIFQGNPNWFIPTDSSSGTKSYRQGALQTPFTKSGELYIVKIELRDPILRAIEFVLKDGSSNRWMKLNNGNFRIDLPEHDENILHSSISNDLIQRKAYLIWESKGRPISSPEQKKQDYDDAVRELQSQLKKVSLNQSQSSCCKSATSKPLSDNRVHPGFVSSAYCRRHNVDQWLHKDSGHGKRMNMPVSALIDLVERTIGGDKAVRKQSHKVGKYEIVVLTKITKNDHHILVAINTKGSTVLHWGMSKSSPGEWSAPPSDILPERSQLLVGACQTCFVEVSTGQGSFQYVDINLQQRNFLGMQFVIYAGGSWIKVNGENFFVLLKSNASGKDLMTKQIIGSGREAGGLYVLDTTVRRPVALSSVSTPFDEHCQLGHPSLPVLKKLCPQFQDLSSLDCESCQFAKHHRLFSPPRVNKRSSFPFELVHSDVWGPCSVVSKPGFRYFVTFVDDYSRTTWLYLMKSRSELFTNFTTFCAEIKTQFNVSVHILRSDNAKEYFSGQFQSFMIQNGILHQSSCVDTPSQNGVAERKNRHLLETTRALLFQTRVPKHFWADAVSTACFLINRMPSSVLQGETPYGTLFPHKPVFPVSPRIFGCTCFVRDVRPQVTKLDPKALKCVFLGYSRLQKGYRCFSPSLDKYLVSSDVTFMEHLPFFPMSSDISTGDTDVDDELVYHVHQVSDGCHSKPPITQVYSRRERPPASDPVPISAPPSDPAPESSQTTDELPIALRKGTRSCTHPISAFVSYERLSSPSQSFVASLDSTTTPKSVSEALSHPGWRHAMIDEMNALDDNGTWDLVHLPVGKKPVGCRWVFAVKVNSDGSVARLKARLVAKGFAQTYGVDYSDTFSPVAKMGSIRLFISLAAHSNWPLHQLDIKNAFLHGDLQEKVYMEQPPGFVAQGEYGKVCRLRKSLYGLKQSPRAWFGKFSQAIEIFGMKKCKCDHSVFYKHSASGIILLVVYVDDIVITGSDMSGISSLKSFLHGQFHTKDLGALKYFLGIEVSRSKKGIFLSQRKYVLDLLSETGKSGAKPCSAPMTPNAHLTSEGEPFEDPGRYRRLVGKLNYLTVTRPDIAYSVSVVSQFMSSPTVDHWTALEQILCYLKGTPGRGLLYKNYGHTQIECFSDADWAGDKDDRRSTTGYCVFVGGNLISWKSKKQHVVSRSSAECEYRAMSQSVCEIMWIRHLLSELGFNVSIRVCDNQAALHIASNPVFHERTKHIEIDCHFVREKPEENIIATAYIGTNEQLGDIFTKALNGVRVNYICNKLGMSNIYALA